MALELVDVLRIENHEGRIIGNRVLYLQPA
jgi:hypothetical protein